MDDIKFVRLRFRNTDAGRRVISVMVDAASVDDVVEWYKSHHAGDRFTVARDPVQCTPSITTAKEV